MINCRISRVRPAPMAKRSAISRARAGARLVSRPATFAHATSSTAPAKIVNITTKTAFGGIILTRASNSVRTSML